MQSEISFICPILKDMFMCIGVKVCARGSGEQENATVRQNSSYLIFSSQRLRRAESTGLSMFPEAAEIEKQRNTFLQVESSRAWNRGIWEFT